MDGSNSTQNEEVAAKAKGDTEDCQMMKLAEKMDAASLFLTPEQQDCVTLKAGGKSFTFKKSILIKDSEYFATCFKNESFIEGKTLTVEFDDIDPDLLGIYLYLASMQAVKDTATFDPALMKEPKRLKPMVDLYEIADRFMNQNMTAIIGPSIAEMAMDHPVKMAPKTMTKEDKEWSMQNYKEAFEALGDGDEARNYLREQLLAAYCRWIPLDNFRDDLSALEDAPEFVRELMICFAMLLTDIHFDWEQSRCEGLVTTCCPRSWPNTREKGVSVLTTGDWTQWSPFPATGTPSSPVWATCTGCIYSSVNWADIDYAPAESWNWGPADPEDRGDDEVANWGLGDTW